MSFTGNTFVCCVHDVGLAPALTVALVALGARQGGQPRPAQVASPRTRKRG